MEKATFTQRFRTLILSHATPFLYCYYLTVDERGIFCSVKSNKKEVVGITRCVE